MSDDEKSGGSGVADVVGGAAGLAGGGYFADRVVKGGVVKKLTSPESVSAIFNGNLKGGLKIAGIDEKHEETVLELLKHDDVQKAVVDADRAINDHRALSQQATEALKNAKDVESVTFVAENGTHTMQVKIKGQEKPLELKGIKQLPEGVKAGEPITDLAKIKALGATHTVGEASWLHRTLTAHKLDAAHVEKVVIKPGAKKGTFTAEIHLTDTGATHVHGEKIPEGGKILKDIPVSKLPEGVTAEAVAKAENGLELAGDEVGKLAKAGEHGWLKQATVEAETVMKEGALKPLQAALRKGLGFGGGFKLAGGAGKAGVIAAAAVGAYAGAKIIGGMFGGSHADKVASERALVDAGQTRT